MYKYIYLVIAFIAVPIIVGAVNDVSLAENVIIGDYNLTISGSTASIDSIAVDSSSFSVTVSAGSSIHVDSAMRKSMTVSGVTGSYVTQQCGLTNSLNITVPASETQTQTAVITVSSDACTSQSSGSGSPNTSSASPGASSSGVSTVTTPIPATLVATPTVAPTVITQIRIQSTFSTDLSRGTTNSDVSRLQQLLAQDPVIYPEGLVTGYFGPATERAVKRFQAKYGIDQVGRVGPATRAKLGMVFGTVGAIPAVPATPATTVSNSAVFAKNMSKGATGDDVKRLQQLLNTDVDTTIATDGIGSLGNETTSFGSLTEKAVQRFQVKYNIAKEGDSGYGTVGPLTRAMLQEVFGIR